MGRSAAARSRVSGPLGGFEAAFVAALMERGYARSSVALRLRVFALLSSWLEREGLESASLTPAVLSRFFAAERPPRGVGIRPFLELLREVGAAPAAPTTVKTGPVEALLDRYRRYLKSERRLDEYTIVAYVGRVRPFLERRVAADVLELERMTAPEIDAFVQEECLRRSRQSAKVTVTALRSLLRFLQIEGVVSDSLAETVPTVASWRMAQLPRPLPRGEMTRLLASCDRSTAVGRRDLAILSLLVRLGLRRGEVVRLTLDDIDWAAGELIVRGKGERHDRMPLPCDVGEALADYLSNGRPAVASRSVFIRVVPPIVALGRSGVSNVVLHAANRAGVHGVSAHRLRHTVATETLREGASLAEVGELLRHAHLATTAIYAKVDRERLRTLARPWPGAAA
jgi:integrase/recombinase XerD